MLYATILADVAVLGRASARQDAGLREPMRGNMREFFLT
jgi:hypothetical protein